MILALAGGVGGAKLARGLAEVLGPGELTIVVNTGDDFVHLGLRISPDIDTMVYTLAGRANPEQGWGVAGETWHCLDTLAELGGETWFRLGDRDLAMHLYRSTRLANGDRLGAITAEVCRRLDITHWVTPMTDADVATVCLSKGERIAFQDYFVRRRSEPVLDGIEYSGADSAAPSAAFAGALDSTDLEGIVLCPSNPYLSIGPILSVGDVRDRIAQRRWPVVAVSPIIGGEAVKGPAAKLLRELGGGSSPASVASCYRGLVDIMVIDPVDADYAPEIEALGMRAVALPILMRNIADAERLARECVALVRNGRTP